MMIPAQVICLSEDVRIFAVCALEAGSHQLESNEGRRMKMIKIAALLLMAACTGYGFYAFAQGRPDARPAVAAIGTSSSNGVSFAWFYEAPERTVYVCRVGQGAADTLDCKAKTTLP